MFCGKCGTENNDNAAFCSNCGAKLKQSSPASTAASPLSASNNKNRKIGIIAAAAALVVIIILGTALFGGRSYKSTIDTYVTAQFDADAEAVFKLIPDKMMDYMLEEDGYDSRDLDDFIDEAGDMLQDQLDTLDSYLGEGWTSEYEILYTEDLKGDDLDAIKDSYEDTDVKVSAAKIVEVEMTVKADETESSNTLEIYLIKVGRSWYLDVMSMGGLF